MNTIFDTLNKLYEDYSAGTLELAKPINLLACRMITSDVVDIRGELEKSACLYYNNVLTRVAGKVLIFRDSSDGKEVLLRLWRSAVYLPGGGLDIEKDGYDISHTIKREVEEEINLEITNLKSSDYNYWRYETKPWVEKHVANEDDRWIGYYTYLYTADYDGYGNNDLPEEAGRYTWHKVSDILARPDTKELAMIKKAIIGNGYGNLQEDFELNEGKYVPPVSYFVHDIKGQPAIVGLSKILMSETIFASTEDDGSKYVSTSRVLMSHAGSTWKCGIVLDGSKLADKYKINPINKNSMVYFGLTPSTTKQLQLRAISKYVADDDPTLCFYCIDLNGSRFFTEISEQIYNIFKDIMLAFNAQLAVQNQEPGKGGSDKYKGRTNSDVKKYSDQHPVRYNRAIQQDKLPASRRDHKWHCTESCGYNVENSNLVLKLSELGNYKDLIFEKHGVDITTSEFFRQFAGQYVDESEERITAKLIKEVDKLGIETAAKDLYGLNISNCVKAILINIKHKPAFETNYKDKPNLADDNGNITAKKDNIENIKECVGIIKQYANKYGIPIIFWNSKTTNQDILRELK